jgi:ABC-type polysaccharide/polyol phosphate transport system ATPase subunit
MSSDVAIRIQGLGKSYRIKHQEQHITLAEQALHRLRRPFQRPEVETFWALKDIDLEIKRGEVLGLIGRNGAGKSTLLKILSRITPPTTGRIDVYGRIGSLLEVGTGFHPELTGRENIFLNGSILGMRKSEIERQFDAIVDFAGVDRFLDTPVKRYSSGMYVRLAFAVAAHLETEILLVDEVLAVGDQEFQDKCLGKMGDVAAAGRTIVLVTHNAAAIQMTATEAVLLESGRVTAHGEPPVVLGRYAGAARMPSRRSASPDGSTPVQINRVTIIGAQSGGLDRSVCVELAVRTWEWSECGLGIGIILSTPLGIPVAAGYIKVKVDNLRDHIIPLRLDLDALSVGEYHGTLNIAVLQRDEEWHTQDSWNDAFTLTIHAVSTDGILDRLWDPASYGHHRIIVSVDQN